MRDELLSPAATAEFKRVFNQMLAERLTGGKETLSLNQERLSQLGEIKRMVEAIAAVGISPALVTRLKQAEKERVAIQRSIETDAGQQKALAPDVARLFKEMLMDLSSALQDNRPAAHTILRGVFVKMQIELQGDEVWAKMKTDRLLNLVAGPSITVVAGAGFEPTTFGL